MAKIFKRVSHKIGLPPGSVIHKDEDKIDKPLVRIIDYNEDHIAEKEVTNIEDCFAFREKSTVTWINIDGLHDVKSLEKVGSHFNIHPLVLEDIVTLDQRPKFEDFESYIFTVVKMISFDSASNNVKIEQLSLILFENLIITYQEVRGDYFDPIRERLRSSKGRIRKMKADYLSYCILDTVVDNYFLTLEKIGENIENLEDELIESPSPKTLQIIYKLKREMILLRKSVWPLRELIIAIQRSESQLYSKDTDIFLRDVYDHTIQVMDTLESFRDMLGGMLDTYLSSISNRMNEVMKVLTIIATIFIPLTFIAGIYGMNFENMPELKWSWAYPFGFWSILVIAAGIMLFYFKRKNWL